MPSSETHSAHGLTAPSPLRELAAIAAPAVATMLSYTLMQFVDAFMVARLGQDELVAQNNGATAVYVLMAVMIGGMTVVNTFVSQHLGADEPERCGAYGWAGLWLCAAYAVALAAVAPWASTMFGWMGHNPEVLALETRYTQILLVGGFFTLGARTLSYFFYGAHRPGVVLVAAVAGNVVNIVLNYGFIFGNWGFPRLELTGAAIGTVIGTMVEFAIPMAVFLGGATAARFGVRGAWRPSRCLAEMRGLVRLGWPAGLMQSNEIMCWGLFMTYIVGIFGTAQQAASWIGLRYLQLSFMPALGLSLAVTAVVGKQIGRGNTDAAARRAWLGVKIGMLYMGCCAIGFVAFREPMVRLFLSEASTPEETALMLRVGKQIMVCAAVFQLFDALGIVLIGALRGAGDTLWPGLVTAALSWSVIIGGGYAVTQIAPAMGAVGPWIAAAAYLILLGGFMAVRFSRGKWRTISLTGVRTIEVEPIGAVLPTAGAAPMAAGDPEDALETTHP